MLMSWFVIYVAKYKHSGYLTSKTKYKSTITYGQKFLQLYGYEYYFENLYSTL
jgi:hypothetical protein